MRDGDRARGKFNKRFVPVLYRDLGSEKPRDSIASSNWIMFNEAEKFEESFAQLLSAMTTDLEYVAEHTAILLKAKEWLLGQRDDSCLLEGDQLRKAETWLAESNAKSRNLYCREFEQRKRRRGT